MLKRINALLSSEEVSRLSSAKESLKKRKNPIWIATGRAWTGLNLCSDNKKLLTDLIITNIPLQSGSSASHIYRLKKFGWINIAPFEAATALTQGVGRLKREDDATQRHLWLLDNRGVNGLKADHPHYKIPMLSLESYEEGFSVDSAFLSAASSKAS